MAKVRWTNTAIEDIYNTMEYLRHSSEKYAEIFADAFFHSVEILERYPRSGRVVPEFNQEQLREIIHKSYRIVYLLTDIDTVEILTVHPSALPLTDLPTNQDE